MRFLNWIVIGCLMISGCTRTILNETDYQIIQGIAIGGLSGLNILVETGEWNGNQEVTEKITPVKITIYNKSDFEINLQYSNFCFRSKKNNCSYAAMPPYEIRGTTSNPCIILPYPFPVKLEIEYNRKFRVAHYCARMYPDLPAYGKIIHVNKNYYNHYYGKWARIRLPEVEMISKLVPEGVLGKDGYVSGYIYFEKIASNEKQLEFCMDFIDAQNYAAVGRIIIPLCIVKK